MVPVQDVRLVTELVRACGGAHNRRTLPRSVHRVLRGAFSMIDTSLLHVDESRRVAWGIAVASGPARGETAIHVEYDLCDPFISGALGQGDLVFEDTETSRGRLALRLLDASRGRGLLILRFEGGAARPSPEFSRLLQAVVDARLQGLATLERLATASRRQLSTAAILREIASETSIEIVPETSIETAAETLEDAQRRCICGALRATGGRIYGAGGAAVRLGLRPSTLQSKMKKLGIERDAFVSSVTPTYITTNGGAALAGAACDGAEGGGDLGR